MLLKIVISPPHIVCQSLATFKDSMCNYDKCVFVSGDLLVESSMMDLLRPT